MTLTSLLGIRTDAVEFTAGIIFYVRYADTLTTAKNLLKTYQFNIAAYFHSGMTVTEETFNENVFYLL